MSDSTIYTIGTALNRARDHGASVDVLVDGFWLRGDVMAVDGYGVVLSTEHNEHSVIRIESVSVVKVATVAPIRAPLPAGARPMPASGA